MKHRQGFTVVEMTVVIAFASILAAIALPVIQQSREGSRLVECANKMSTIAAGSAMYEDANGRMPPWSTGIGPIPDLSDHLNGIHQTTGAIAYILPFVGEQKLFDLMPEIATDATNTLEDSPFSGISEFLSDPGMLAALSTKPDLLICPANADYADAFLAQLFYEIPQTTDGPNNYALFYPIGSTEFGRTSYLPSIGGFLRDSANEGRALDITLEDAAGAMRNRLTSVPVSELGDGSSNTILWGESLGGIEDAASSGTGKPQLTGGNFSLFSMGLLTGDTWLIDDGINFGSATGSFAFLIGSVHPDGCNVAMADGSIRFIDRRTGRGVMAALGCGNDGWITPRR